MGNGLTQVKAGIQDDLQAILERGRSVSTFLDRVIWPKYQQAQINRWQSENASEGSKWAALDSEYAKLKKKKFAAFPGAGNVLMVATSRLSQGAQGRDGSYFMRIVGESQMSVSINSSALPYASYAAARRPFMSFNPATIAEWTGEVAEYIMAGKQ